MRYDGSNPLHAQQARSRLEKMIRDGRIFDLTEKKPQRTRQANAYLHVILSYFACQTGNAVEWVKQKYYKELVNPDTFIRKREDPWIGTVECLRSSADLDSSEFSLTVERFRNWSAANGIYLPSPEDHRLLELVELEIERNKEHL